MDLRWLPAIVLAVLAIFRERRQKNAESSETQWMEPQGPTEAETIAIIRQEARAQGVPEAVALAFACAESRLRWNAEGDRDWAAKKPALYQRLIRDNPTFAANPARNRPEAWRSIGLFQLLAPYHVEPHESPDVLFDPRVNAHRGVRHIARLLSRTNGDPVRARWLYVGCGADGMLCSAEVRDRIAARIRKELEQWT